MKSQTFEIFEKDNKITLDVFQIILIYLFIATIISILFEFQKSDLKITSIIITYIFFPYSIGFIISNFFRHKKPSGRFNGQLSFSAEGIYINQRILEIDKIEKIQLEYCHDIRGDFYFSFNEFNPYRSAGVKNSCIITLSNGEILNLNFKQTKTKKLSNLKSLLFHYYNLEKISFKDLSKALNVFTYQDIQNLKMEFETKFKQ